MSQTYSVRMTCETCLESSQVATQCHRCGDFWLLCCLVSGLCARCSTTSHRAPAVPGSTTSLSSWDAVGPGSGAARSLTPSPGRAPGGSTLTNESAGAVTPTPS